MMKNLTLTIDEGLLDQARRVALEEKTSVNAMVRDLLARKVAASTTEARRAEARRQLAELSRHSTARPAPDFRFNRDDIYAERLSGHERDRLRGDGDGVGPEEGDAGDRAS
jgi:hypothetical protein